MTRNPNPQGKGQVPVLAALTEARAHIPAPPKHVEQVSVELFTSLFVLESEFRFKPVPGRPYWLYRKQGRFRLSPIAPQEWHRSVYGQHVGRCELQQDLTWTLELSAEAAQDASLTALIAERKRALDRRLREAASIDRALPVYEAGLPFYQRVFASALACSLAGSMRRAGIHGLAYEEAKGLLEGPGGAA